MHNQINSYKEFIAKKGGIILADRHKHKTFLAGSLKKAARYKRPIRVPSAEIAYVGNGLIVEQIAKRMKRDPSLLRSFTLKVDL